MMSRIQSRVLLTDKKYFNIARTGCIIFIPVIFIISMTIFLIEPLTFKNIVALIILALLNFYLIYAGYYILQSKTIHVDEDGIYFDESNIPWKNIHNVKLCGESYLLRTHWLRISFATNSAKDYAICVINTWSAEQIFEEIQSNLS